MADIVDDFLARLRQHIPESTPDRLRALEVDIRGHWGGTTKAYIAKRPAVLKQHRLALALQQAAPGVAAAFQQAGVRRSFGYELLARVDKKRGA